MARLEFYFLKIYRAKYGDWRAQPRDDQQAPLTTVGVIEHRLWRTKAVKDAIQNNQVSNQPLRFGGKYRVELWRYGDPAHYVTHWLITCDWQQSSQDLPQLHSNDA